MKKHFLITIVLMITFVFTACTRSETSSMIGSGAASSGAASSGTQTAADDNELRVGSFISGHAYSDEVNSYNFRTTESGRIVLEIESDIAIYVEVYDNDEFIATNSDDLGNMNSRLEFQARNTVYRLEVRSYVRNTDGNFRITAKQSAAAIHTPDAAHTSGSNPLAGRIWQYQSGEMLYFFKHYRELSTVFFRTDGHVFADGSGFSISGRWQITNDGRLEIRPDNKSGELNIPVVLIFSFQIKGNLLILTDENPNFGASGDYATYYEIFLQG